MEYIKKLHSIPNIESLRGNIRGKKVFLRADFNVPIHNGKITDTYRIDATMQTFAFLKEEGAITIVVSHIETKDVESPTLVPVFLYLVEKYPQYTVYFCDSFLNRSDVETCLNAAKEGEFVLFENIRRADKVGMSEKLNDIKLAEYFKSFVEFYIQDAFAVSHRKHASVSALPQLFDANHKVAGLQLYKEITYLTPVLEPQKPFVVILSGAKFSTKLPLIEKYVQSADLVFVGGALFNNVLKSLGYEIGVSLIDEDAMYVNNLVQSNSFTEKVYIPKVVTVKNTITGSIRDVSITDVQKDEAIMDISSESIIDFTKHIMQLDAKTILWNGPVGNFEVEPFAQGTEILAEKILGYMGSSVLQDVKLVIGGGDTVSALSQIEGLFANPSVCVSTGGGAMLEFLEKDGDLPGIKSLL